MSKPRAKMTKGERAKQFMPFSALKGLSEALAEKEKVYVEKTELSEDMANELEEKLRKIGIGAMASITYFDNGEYLKVNGKVAKIDIDNRQIQIVNNKIKFEDILIIE